MTNALPFQDDSESGVLPLGAHESDSLLINIDGYEGPLDVLLDLARDQKLDLTKISILQLARQYLAFIDRASELRLDLAADYLVMAAWLAYLKSRLLLPRDESKPDEPSAAQMAEALSFQLRRLEAMRNAALAMQKLPKLGQIRFTRGAREALPVHITSTWAIGLYDLLKAYGDIRQRKESSSYQLPTFHLMSMDDAMLRLGKMLGNLPRTGPYSAWTTLASFLPDDAQKPGLYSRSSMASLFTAGLEFAKQGQIELRQDAPFRPIYLRASYRNDNEKSEEHLVGQEGA